MIGFPEFITDTKELDDVYDGVSLSSALSAGRSPADASASP